jgi:hypothetical protein
MPPSRKSSKPKAPRAAKTKPAPATLRSTSGAGFEFEDLICAWQLVKALSGEHAPGIGSVITQVQAQVSTMGWRIDDLLLIAQGSGAVRQLAISAKGNVQVTAAGLPSDFVTRAWEQWRDAQGPFNRMNDAMALVTLGTHPAFDPAWSEVKNACSGANVALAMSRIRSNGRQSVVFNSVQEPGGASEEETIELIRRLHVLPTTLQFADSGDKAQAIAQCRRLLASSQDDEAHALWRALVDIAEDVRLRSGSATVPGLLRVLRGQFGLRHHPDFERDWATLAAITADRRARIETVLPSGYAVPRMAEAARLQAAVASNLVTVVFGDSGAGKSALVKSVLDGAFPSWNQVWLGPEELKAALSVSRRGMLPLGHDLSLVLSATVKPENVLVLDSAERIEASEFIVVRGLLQTILPSVGEEAEGAWRVIIVTQTQSWVDGEETMLGGRKAQLVEVDALKGEDVKLALLPSSGLGWLAAHDDTIAALTNLRTLSWVIKAGAALGGHTNGLTSHTAIADRLWKYWTEGRADVQALMMRLAQREASFERSFALTDLEPVHTATFTHRPPELPLRLNARTNRIEFEHDLASDWARFQFLKQIWTDTAQWVALAGNPLWTNALRMLGQFLLRQAAEAHTAWDMAFKQAEAAKTDLAGDILLDALCLDPEAERFLTERVDLLLDSDGKHLKRLLLRFHHIATVPTRGIELGAEFGVYVEAQYRSIVFGRWWPVLRFLVSHRERLSGMVSSALAKVIETWLTKTPLKLADGSLMPFRQEMAAMALSMARTVQVEKGHGVMYVSREPSLYTAALAGAADLPAEVGGWALELAGRREIDDGVKRRVARVQLQQAKVHAERLKTDATYKARHDERMQLPRTLGSIREQLPPWPLGARASVDMDFRDACIDKNGIQFLIHAQPPLAAEVLLALIVEDQPEQDYGSRRHEIDLGLAYPKDAYPTAFWKSPFFPFLQLAPETALPALIDLVNFCTERWVAGVMYGQTGEAPAVTLEFEGGLKRTFPGWWQVFGWLQSSELQNGNLFCALDALERWLIQQLDAGKDVNVHIDTILRDGHSAAFVSVLVNIAKYRPTLLAGPLAPLVTFPDLFSWDTARVRQVSVTFDAYTWIRRGEAMFNLARDWALAPHRQRSFRDVAAELLLADSSFAKRLQELLPTWAPPEDPKDALEQKLLMAQLDRANYPAGTDPVAKVQITDFLCPEELAEDVRTWKAARSTSISYLTVPDHCRQRLQAGLQLSDDEAAYLFDLIESCVEGTEDDADARARCRVAAASALIVLASRWIALHSEAHQAALEIVRSSIAAASSSAEAVRDRRRGGVGDELAFIAYAAMHLWLAEGESRNDWEQAVVRLLTSGDRAAAVVVVERAYANCSQLGTAWWRLLQAGLLWSGLVLLAPQHGDGDDAERTWRVWLARMRRVQLTGPTAGPDDLDFERVVAWNERLEFRRRVRLYEAGDRAWRGPPQRSRSGTLDWHFLRILFDWLIDGTGTGDVDLDVRLTLRIWEYEASRAASRDREYGEYDLPSQRLGYDILSKLAALSLSVTAGTERAVWGPVLAHGPAAHYALQHFISGLFLRLMQGEDAVAFERVWREVAEFGLAADWSQRGLWFYGERLKCDLLGFGQEKALARLQAGAALRMRDLYERWAVDHLARDEECVTRFCRFLTTDFGAALRFDGLRWLAAMLRSGDPSRHVRRDGTADALMDLAATSLRSDSQFLARDGQARQALMEIAAVLAAMNTPAALALQERIRQLR